MFIPLHDANDLTYIKRQYVTLGLIAANIIIWLMFAGAEAASLSGFIPNLSFGFVPSDIFNIAEVPHQYEVVPEPLNFITYAFLHADFWHLAGNMLFLWVFGDNVEDAMGHIRFLIFYLICAAAGALAHGAMDMASQAPLIGASGAIAGVVAAYLILHPKVRVWILVLLRIPLPLPAGLVILFWIGFQVFQFLADDGSNVSFASHLGGIAAGLALVALFKRRDVPLFDREIVTPKAVEVKRSSTKSSVEQSSKKSVPRSGSSRRWGRKER